MSGSPAFVELPGLAVSVEEVVHHPEAQTPADRPHCFAYHILIQNDSVSTVTIKARKWVVTDAQGEVTAVEGDGVVGQCPRLEPGECFRYHSFHLFDGPWAEAEGGYFGLDEKGRRVVVRIPKFRMVVPE